MAYCIRNHFVTVAMSEFGMANCNVPDAVTKLNLEHGPNTGPGCGVPLTSAIAGAARSIAPAVKLSILVFINYFSRFVRSTAARGFPKKPASLLTSLTSLVARFVLSAKPTVSPQSHAARLALIAGGHLNSQNTHQIRLAEGLLVPSAAHTLGAEPCILRMSLATNLTAVAAFA